MGPPTGLTDSASLVVTDASAIINLNATGRAHQILTAIPNRIAVVDVIPAELDLGRSRGRSDADQLAELVSHKVIEVVTLDDESDAHFENLVVGSAAETLDDGEAATIAYAVAHDGIAIVDERKANRICAERFARLRRGCTLDLLAHPRVTAALSEEDLADAVFRALVQARMRVIPAYIDWVVRLIGTDRVNLCHSLPAAVRA